MNTFKFETLKGYTEQQIINGFMSFVSNQRYNDKSAVAYFVGMIDFYQGLYAANNKRKEILETLERHLDEATIYMVIRSEYVASAVANQIVKHKF
jgi:hypothetical protein